ncbi:Brix domain-domain-containing protein [Leucosporidium creatinivorum]|uniref:Brix domain-domain-containing protein n=1 Tax=Leucosporidium creatinivorum TaxID=106004 RepID=A0A1Y2E626_9BASI|nr:Brix domain-domain-containing protein [Leucosporidium creatinivorum]
MPRKGSKRRKTRTHVKPAESADPNAPKTPKSFVVKSGTVGTSVAALTKDVRKVLEPNTGSRLRERKANRLRDYVSMSGPLGVTHLLVFSQPPNADITAQPKLNKSGRQENEEERADRSLVEGTTTLNLRLIRLPRGPTLSFKVLRYSLAADVLRMARRPRSIGREFAEGPLLILSGFGGEDKQLKLMTTVFQNLFHPIHVQSMPLSSARRVVLLSYNPVTRTIDFRHYVISVRPVGVSRPIRKIIAGSTNNKAPAVPLSRKRLLAAQQGSEDESEEEDGFAVKSVGGGKAKGILDLSRADDISDYILRHEGMGFITSDSEISDMSDVGSQSGHSSGSEEDEKRGKVRLAGDYVGRGNRGKSVKGEKRAVRLVELGPRMELGLVKVEEGVGEGEVMFHEMGESCFFRAWFSLQEAISEVFFHPSSSLLTLALALTTTRLPFPFSPSSSALFRPLPPFSHLSPLPSPSLSTPPSPTTTNPPPPAKQSTNP